MPEQASISRTSSSNFSLSLQQPISFSCAPDGPQNQIAEGSEGVLEDGEILPKIAQLRKARSWGSTASLIIPELPLFSEADGRESQHCAKEIGKGHFIYTNYSIVFVIAAVLCSVLNSGSWGCIQSCTCASKRGFYLYTGRGTRFSNFLLLGSSGSLELLLLGGELLLELLLLGDSGAHKLCQERKAEKSH